MTLDVFTNRGHCLGYYREITEPKSGNKAVVFSHVANCTDEETAQNIADRLAWAEKAGELLMAGEGITDLDVISDWFDSLDKIRDEWKGINK